MNPSIQHPPSNEARAPHTTLTSLVGRIAHAIDHELSSGDVAALRRLPPGLPDCGAFWMITTLWIEPAGLLSSGCSTRDEAERRWGAILQAQATLRSLHRPGFRLGRALAEADLAEMRFLRLLRAEGERLREQLRTLAHFLTSKALPSDQSDLARLVLSDGRSDVESVRRQMARSYYSHANRS